MYSNYSYDIISHLAPPTLSGQGHTTQGHGKVPPLCIQSHWSKWINRDSPSVGAGDIEAMTSQEMSVFCAAGRISKIECITDTGIPSYSTGEIISCTINNGLECLNDNNFPVPCSDYKVRYFCDCGCK